MEEFVVDYMCKRKGVLRVKSTVWWDSYVKHTAVANIKPLMTLVFFSFIDCSPVESLNDHLRIIFPKHHRSLQIEDKHCVLSTDCFVWWYYYYEHGHTRSAPVNSIAYLFHVITESTSHSADHQGLTEARLLANLIQHTGIDSELGRTENKWTDWGFTGLNWIMYFSASCGNIRFSTFTAIWWWS